MSLYERYFNTPPPKLPSKYHKIEFSGCSQEEIEAMKELEADIKAPKELKEDIKELKALETSHG